MTAKWVEEDKTHSTGAPAVWPGWVARDVKGKNEQGREDFFSSAPPIELMRFMLSRQATWREGGKVRKTLYLDVKTAHLSPKCNQDVYVELPEKAGAAEGERGKLIHRLFFGCRQAAQAWEEHYSALVGRRGFKRLRSVPVAFVHTTRDLMGVVHGDDYIFVGIDEDLYYVFGVLQSQCELKNCGKLGNGDNYIKKVDMMGRVIEIEPDGISWDGNQRHQVLLEEYSGMGGRTQTLTKNGYIGEANGDEGEDVALADEDASAFRMLAASLN